MLCLVFATSPVAAQQVWFAPPDNLDRGARTFNHDFPQLFDAKPAWNPKIDVFKISPKMGSTVSPAEQLNRINAFLKDRHIALAVSIGAMLLDNRDPVPGECGFGVEGSNRPGRNTIEFQRLKQLGIEVRYVAMDEPLTFGHYYNKKNACRYSIDDVARRVAAAIAEIKQIYPDVRVVDEEAPPITTTAQWNADFPKWLEAYRRATGAPLDAIVFDLDWRQPWQEIVVPGVRVAHQAGVRAGIFLDGTGPGESDADAVAAYKRNMASVAALHAPFDFVEIANWTAHPANDLPQSDPNSLTGVLHYYYATYNRLPTIKPSHMTPRHSLIIASLLASPCAASGAGPAAAQQVWLAPDSETPDLVEMFQHPELWAQSRSRVSVIKLGPQQVRATGKPAENSIDGLVKVGAFEKLAAWHIDVAIEAPAIKPWDCTAVHARQMTIDYIRSVNAMGGKVRYIAMDEPLAAGVRQCHDSFEGALDKTADYIKELSRDSGLAAQGLTPEIGDIEAYPFFGATDIERWVRGLEQRGAKPRFLHLDVNIHRVDVDRSVNAPRDLAELTRFLRGENIPFGIILWPGYNPVPSDRAFHDLTVSWARRVHQAIGQSDEVIVQSWVVRGGAACSMSDPACDMTHSHCAASDAAGCGKHTVPLNLPESGAFTLTRTLLDSLRILQ